MQKTSYLPYTKSFLKTKTFPLLCLVFLILFPFLAHISLWVETEIFPTHSSQYLFSKNRSAFLFSLKPLFYLILYISSLFSSLLSLFPMTGARLLFAFNGLLMMVFMYIYIQKKTKSDNAILAVLVLASSYLFLDRGFRIRSDLLLSSLSLGLLCLIPQQEKGQKSSLFYILGPFLCSLFLISPKGIYWFLFVSCLIFSRSKNPSSFPQNLYENKPVQPILFFDLKLSF